MEALKRAACAYYNGGVTRSPLAFATALIVALPLIAAADHGGAGSPAPMSPLVLALLAGAGTRLQLESPVGGSEAGETMDLNHQAALHLFRGNGDIDNALDAHCGTYKRKAGSDRPGKGKYRSPHRARFAVI